MPYYRVASTASVTLNYYVEAKTPEEAREKSNKAQLPRLCLSCKQRYWGEWTLNDPITLLDIIGVYPEGDVA